MEKCLLIYDDDREILDVCQLILNPNYRVVTKVNCDSVVEDVLDIQPHLILMDLWIPEIGGEKAVELLKNHQILHRIPVIIFSANDDTEKICTRERADGFLKKPFDLKMFRRTIHHAIEGG